MKKIVVIGSVNQDISLTMRNLPSEGDTVIAQSIKYNGGGKGANQAVSLNRMGSNTTFICAVGNDENGTQLVDNLVKDGIHVIPIAKENESTGFAIIAVDSSGKNNIIVYPGANYALNSEDIMSLKEELQDASYCVLQFELQLPVIETVLECCKSMNIPVVLNPAPYHPDFDLEWLKNVEYFIPNENEFCSLFDDKPDALNLDDIKERARKLCKQYDVKIIVTLGSIGSVYIDQETDHFVASYKVNAIDTTAAGDTYIGAFVSRIDCGDTVLDAMKFATKASSLTVSTKGAQESIPYLKQMV